MEVKDIEGVIICIGDEVYYSRKHPHSARGILVKCVVTKITSNGIVMMDKYKATSPSEQIIIIKSLREKKFERLLE